jgi:hypothetical protein
MARNFAGGTDKISVSNSLFFPGSASIPADIITIAAWFYGTDFSADYCTVAERNRITVNQHQYTFYVRSTGKMAYYWCEGGITLDPGTLTFSANTWNHVAATLDQINGFTSYINGAVDVTHAASLLGSNANQAFLIGNSSSGGTPFKGYIGHVAIWNVVLSKFEIGALALGARPNTVRPQALVFYWPLDGYGHPALDLGFTRNNGALTGTTLVPGPPFISAAPVFPGVPMPQSFMTVIPPSFVLMPQIVM